MLLELAIEICAGGCVRGPDFVIVRHRNGRGTERIFSKATILPGSQGLQPFRHNFFFVILCR